MDLENFDSEAYRNRIRVLRRLVGMNQTQFADWLGIAYKKWNHYERGYPVSRETAFLLHRKIYWFSTDWLWHGDTKGLSAGTLEQIRAIEREERKHKPLQTSPPLPKTKVRKRLPKKPKS